MCNTHNGGASVIQDIKAIEQWYQNDDPWGYESHPDDAKRVKILLSELPNDRYKRVLDIGCGHGFVTRALPGDEVLGIDISEKAIAQAKSLETERLHFIPCSLFDVGNLPGPPFDLIVITGVLYAQYIGRSLPHVYRIIDRMLANNGLLVCVHIDEWYRARFPYLLMHKTFYPYREYTHRLEIYVK